MLSQAQRYYLHQFLKAIFIALVSLPIVLPRNAYRRHRWRLEEPGCTIEPDDVVHGEEYRYNDEQRSLRVFIGKLHDPLISLHSFLDPITNALVSYDKYPNATARMLKYLARVEGYRKIMLEIDEANPPTDHFLAEIDTKLECKGIHRQPSSRRIVIPRFNSEKRDFEQVEIAVVEWNA